MRRTATLILLALLGALLVPGAPATAAARVSVAGLDGGARASLEAPTTLRLSGSGFQSVPKAFGGIYVLFGTVDGSAWAPSRGGTSGGTFRYVPDAESADNAGYQRFVAFPGSSTADEANGGALSADGSWSTSIVVPGPRFTARDRAGNAVDVDCTRVTCGVITIGAHGVANGSNETFTPVEFVGSDSGSAGGSRASGGGSDSAGPPGESSGTGSGDRDASGEAERPAGHADEATAAKDGETDEDVPGEATVGIDQATAVAGRVLSFTGQGFTPGEQVVAVLDDGVLAVGPLTAGTHGEVAGLLELPADLRLGTHVLRLSGASSGRQPEIELVVTRDPADAASSSASAAGAGLVPAPAPALGVWGTGFTAGELAVGIAGLLLLLLVVSSAITGVRRRRASRAAA